MKKTLAIVLALLVAPAAFADDTAKTGTTKTDTTKTDTTKTDTNTNTAQTKLTDAELQIIAHYHNVNLLEIDLGKTAKLRAKTAAVKDYGTMLVKEHGDSDKKLQAMVRKTNQRIPMEKTTTEAEKQDKSQQKLDVASLKKLRGNAFDNKFLSMMVDGHEKELAKIDANINTVTNSDLADNLRNMKPVLQMHADKARDLQKSEPQAMK
jgi:putative membrane protein